MEKEMNEKIVRIVYVGANGTIGYVDVLDNLEYFTFVSNFLIPVATGQIWKITLNGNRIEKTEIVS
jgi:hypothetical protein